jgi:hypothetical protein
MMDEKNEKENQLEKMRNIRDIAEKEIFEEQSISNSNKERSVENIKYLGKFKINDKEIDLYMLEENFDGNNKYKFVDEQGNKIAIKTEQGIVFAREELSVDKMEELQKAFLQAVPEKDLNKMEKQELEKITKELGISEKDIDKMSEIGLDKEKQKDLKDEEKDKEIDKEELKTVNTLQEMKTTIRINEREQLGQRFNFEEANQKPESKFEKIAVVHSNSLKQLDGKAQNGTKYSFVAVREDGSAQRIDDVIQMDNAFGTSNTEETMKFDADNTVRKNQTTQSRFKIKGTNETLSIENGQYGELKIYYGGKAKGSNEIVETQLETRNVRPTSRDLRETQSQYKGIENKNNQLEEANQHFKRGEEKISKEDADGDKNTQTHSHDDDTITLLDGTKTTFKEEAQKINCSEETLRAVYENTEGESANERLEKAKDKTQDIEAEEMGAPTLNRSLH